MNNNSLVITAIAFMFAGLAFAAEPTVPTALSAKPSIAKICTLCHKAEPNAVRGYFDIVSFKAKTIQVKIDDSVELFVFDEDEIKVVNDAGKTGDGELLKDNLIKRGHEIKVEYVEKNGVKSAVKLIEKPPVTISAEMLMKVSDIEKLVSLGPEKGKYFLFDSRPLPRFQEGSIPTAVNLPYPAFDKLADKLLPKDKDALTIFYCSGVTCNMSPGSADKARRLGYKNLKVFKDGMPGWLEKNYGVLSVQFLKEAWIDKDVPFVLLDVRTAKETGTGFIKGAVAFSTKQADKLAKILDIKRSAPIIVYDQNGSKIAAIVATKLIKEGFKRVLVLSGGFEAWKTAKYDIASGKLITKATYTPKLRQGEMSVAEFKKYVAELPPNVMIIDARSAAEAKVGMLKTAKLIPVGEIRDRLGEIPKDKLIVFYCNTGVIAEVAYNTLKELGYTNVKYVIAKVQFEEDGKYSIDD